MELIDLMIFHKKFDFFNELKAILDRLKRFWKNIIFQADETLYTYILRIKFYK